MARGKAVRKPPAKAAKPKMMQLTKSRRRAVRKKRTTKKNVPQISYKDSHSIGRRKSTNVPTYSESGRLYYDLHVRYGLSNSFVNKEEKLAVVADHNRSHESEFSDTTTVACNENTGPSSSSKKVNVEVKKRRPIKRRQSPAKSPPSHLNSRREASLNAGAKVNMLFESTKKGKCKRRSLPTLPANKVVNVDSSESDDKSSSDKQFSKKPLTKAKRTRLSEPSPLILSPPQKRLAGLNATAIISACIRSSDTDNKKPRRGRPPKSSLNAPLPQKVENSNPSENGNEQLDPAKPFHQSSSPPAAATTSSHAISQIFSPTLSTSNSITTLATVSTDTKVVPASAMPTLERFQSQKVISYGPKCIGVENISRQIIHVPAQSQCVPGPSYANPVAQQIQHHHQQQQRIISHPIVSFTSPQNHSTMMLPDSSSFSPQPPNVVAAAADMHHHPGFTTNQFYLSPFSSTGGHQQQQTFYMSVPSPAPQYQFFPAAPFAYMQPSAQNFMSNNGYTLPMSFSPQIYNGLPFGGGYFVPRPMFTTVSQPAPQLTSLSQTPLVSEVGGSHSVPQPSQPAQRTERAASPSTSTPVKRSSNNKRNSVAVSPATAVTTAPTLEKEKPSPCLWEWVGKPIEKRIFLKPNSPPVMRLCYPSMQHRKDGMVVSPGDNVLLCSGPDRQGAPHVAKVTALFSDPDTGTKMMALLWYYRPESLAPPRRNGVIDCELFASRHCDVNPVDCIDDLAYVYSTLPYARFMALAKYKQECRTHRRPISIVPPLHKTSNDAATTATTGEVNPSGDVSEFPEEATISNVFLCRAWYDFHSRRVMRNLKVLNNNHPISTTTAYTTSNNGSTTSRQPHPQPVTSLSPADQTTRPEISSSTTIQPSTEEELSNGRAVLETTAELSINWADHGEQIAMSLGDGRGLVSTKPSPSPRKNKISKAGTESVASLPPAPTSSSSS